MAVGDGLFDLRAISAKPLGKALPPVAPPPHFKEVIGRTQPEENCKQGIVQSFHRGSSSACILTATSPKIQPIYPFGASRPPCSFGPMGRLQTFRPSLRRSLCRLHFIRMPALCIVVSVPALAD